MLPHVVGPRAIGRISLPAYSMVSRRKVGSFHDDLQKVCSFRIAVDLHCVSFLSITLIYEKKIENNVSCRLINSMVSSEFSSFCFDCVIITRVLMMNLDSDS